MTKLKKPVAFATKTFPVHLTPELYERIDKVAGVTGTKKQFLLIRLIEEGLLVIEDRLAKAGILEVDHDQDATA